MLYHCLSLLLLAYLVWRRPLTGTLVGVLEGIWLLWPLYGLPPILSFNVHLTLAITCLFAWRIDDIPHSTGLALGGAAILGLLYYLPLAALGQPAAVLGGVLCGELVVVAWTAVRLVCRGDNRDAGGLVAPQTLARLNAPLGTVGGTPLSSPNAAPQQPSSRDPDHS